MPSKAYPHREKFYALHFQQRCLELDLPRQLGSEVMLLLFALAAKEDQLKYKPLNFYNGQLVMLTGVKTEKALIRAVKTAVAAGLLHYEKGSKGRGGVYWTMMPSGETPIVSLSKSTAKATENSTVNNGFTVALTVETASEIDSESDRENDCLLSLLPITKNPSPWGEGDGIDFDSWGKAENKLRALGVDTAEQLVNQAKENGTSAQDFLAQVVNCMALADGPGVRDKAAYVVSLLRNAKGKDNDCVPFPDENNTAVSRKSESEKVREQDRLLRELKRKRDRINRECLDAGLDDDQRTKRLEAELPDWYFDQYCPNVFKEKSKFGGPVACLPAGS